MGDSSVRTKRRHCPASSWSPGCSGRSASDLEAVAQVKETIDHEADAESVMEARGLGLTGVLEPLDLALRAREVVGVAGLLGSGRTELANLLFGVVGPG